MCSDNKTPINMNDLKKKGRTLSIKRPSNSSESTQDKDTIQNPISTPSMPNTATGGITLASSPVETDPFKKRITDAGYAILEENDYGVIARQEKGRATFIPKTKHGFDPNEKSVRYTLVLPEHIDMALKIHAAKSRTNAQHYILQLIIADLQQREEF